MSSFRKMVEWNRMGAPIGFLLFITSFLGSIFILFPFFPFLFYHPKLWRHICDRLTGFWFSLPVGLLELFYGVKIRVYGDEVTRGNPAVMIMNHRTRLDWMFWWNALYRMDPWLLVSEKISLKRSLKKVPGAGWAMECNSFIFLERNWEKDQHTLTETIKYYKGMDQSYQLLLFPEGTDLCPQSRQRMIDYATSKGKQVFKHVLHPKTTGLIHIIKTMKQENYLDYIYDIIVAYGEGIVQTEVDFARGYCPNNIQFYVEKYHINVIPNDELGIVEWLKKIWVEKEEILTHFYDDSSAESEQDRDIRRSVEAVRGPNRPFRQSHRNAGINTSDHDVRDRKTGTERSNNGNTGGVTKEFSESLHSANGDICKDQIVSSTTTDTNLLEHGNNIGDSSSSPRLVRAREWARELDGIHLFGIWISFAFWMLTAFVWASFFLALTSMRLYFVLAIAGFVFIEYYYGGIERLAIRRWAKYKSE